jgi:glycosyltransferase involved in cell wall biosynthesis
MVHGPGDAVVVVVVAARGRERGLRKLRINWVLPRPNLSGGVKSNRLIAEAMVRRGHEVTLAFPAGAPAWPAPWRVRSFLHRMRWTDSAAGAHHLQRSTATLLPVERAEVRACDVPDADVSIGTFWQTMEWMEGWPASKGKQAYFVRAYEVTAGEAERVRATYRRPALKLVIARWLQRLMEAEFGDANAVLLPNGVDWSQFSFVPRGKQQRPTVGLTYASIAAKGADTALAAIRIAQKAVPGLRCVCFGAYEVQAEHLPAPEGFEMHVRPSQKEIPELYRRADCWLMPSVEEGFGMPGLEAAACGCPVIATRCGGPEDYVVDGETGYLVPVGDAEAMAARIVDVLTKSDADWRGMSAASHRVAREFDWDRSAQKLEGALLEYLGDNTRLQTPNPKHQMPAGATA